MFFKKIYYIVLFIGGALCSANLFAQQVDSAFADINYLRKQNAWLSAENVAGLKHFSLPKISTAHLFIDKANGGFKNYHQSDNSYQHGLNAQSIYRLNSKVVFSGLVAYHHFKGKNMGGSAFIDPYQSPFNIVEVDDGNKGDKQQETYQLMGGISGQLSQKLAIGGKIDYQTANFAKMKDLRHTNKLLDMDLSVGVLYQLNSRTEIGTNYIYDRRIESTFFRTYGNTHPHYTSLIDFGSFYGNEELFNDHSGYTKNGTSYPLVSNTHGISTQLYVVISPAIKWFNELSYGKRKGYFGREGTGSTIFTNHDANQYRYKGQLSVIRKMLEHHFTLTGYYQNLINKENVYREETTSGGVNRIVYYGQNEVLDQQITRANLNYTLYKQVINNLPEWELGVNLAYFYRQQTTSIKTFYREQAISSYEAHINGKRNLVKGDRVYSIAMGIGYGSGGGMAKYDGLYAPSASTPPASMDLYLYQEYEYFTKPRATANIALQYTKKLKQLVAPYVKINYAYTRAFDTQYLGNSFGTAGVGIGCNF